MIFGALTRPPVFLTIEEVLALHSAAIEEYGGSAGIRDRGLLESAMAMPPQAFGGEFAHTIPFGMAASYAFHICANHPFVDGNKRAAFLAMTVFLHQNGWELTASEDDAADALLAVASSSRSKEDLQRWIESSTRPRPTIELRDFLGSINYTALASTFESIAAGSVEERLATILDAAHAIPAIQAANLGAMNAERSGDSNTASLLRTHAILLTSLHRIAEDMGYEW